MPVLCVPPVRMSVLNLSLHLWTVPPFLTTAPAGDRSLLFWGAPWASLGGHNSSSVLLYMQASWLPRRSHSPHPTPNVGSVPKMSLA